MGVLHVEWLDSVVFGIMYCRGVIDTPLDFNVIFIETKICMPHSSIQVADHGEVCRTLN